MSLLDIEKKIISIGICAKKQGKRTTAFYLFKSLMVLQPLKIIKNIGCRNPSFTGFVCTILLLMISISAVITFWIPEGVIASEVIIGQSQCCDYIVALYDNRDKVRK